MAITFDNIDDIINCGSATTIDNLDLSGTGIGISAWINPTSTGEGTFGRIICKENTGAANEGNWNFLLKPTATIQFEKDYATTDLLVAGAASQITLSVWQHVIITWDGSTAKANVHIYVNGVEISYAAAGNTDGVGAKNTDAALNLNIGNRTGTDRTFDGTMTEIAIFNKVLSAAEITKLYGGGTPLKGTPKFVGGLMGYWPMNEDVSGTVNAGSGYVKDLSGLVNHGTQTGGPVYAAEPTNLPLPSKPVFNRLRPRIFAPGLAR